MVSTLVRFESFGFLPLGTSQIFVYAAAVDNGEALHRHTMDARQEYPQVHRHH
jgi:hypothetical protein